MHLQMGRLYSERFDVHLAIVLDPPPDARRCCDHREGGADHRQLAEIRTSASARQRGQQMAAVLEELAQLPERATITDPVAWQIEQRRDRALPGRDS
jgi:hypothetical protein